MNGVYLRKLSPEEFVQQSTPFLDGNLPKSVKRPLDINYVSQVVSLIQERAKTLAEVPELSSFFFVDELQYDSGLFLSGGLEARSAAKAIMITLQQLERIGTWDATTIEGILRPLAAEINLGTGKFFGLVRIAVTGRTAAPPLFQTMAVLGKGKCLKRLNTALQGLSSLF